MPLNSFHDRCLVQRPKKICVGRPGFNDNGEPITIEEKVAVKASESLIEHYITPDNKPLKGRWTELEHNKFLEGK